MTTESWTMAEMTDTLAKDYGGGEQAVKPIPTAEDEAALAAVQHVEARVLRLPHYVGLPDPHRATFGSSGVDLISASDDPILLNKMGARAIVPTGLAIAVPLGYEIQIRPRSGLAAKHGITVLNAPGTIDSDYRGEIGVIVVNTSTDKYTIKRGDRIAQMVVQQVVIPDFVFVENLDDTERGAGAYGSTGN